MTPGSKIGSSGIIDGSGREIDPVRRAKLESYFGAQIRYIAKQKGYNPEVIEAMMFLSDEKRFCIYPCGDSFLIRLNGKLPRSGPSNSRSKPDPLYAPQSHLF
ncbi:hypothetical protein N8659_00780 [bacterium]|nr:hypothetical protein [bacterium]